MWGLLGLLFWGWVRLLAELDRGAAWMAIVKRMAGMVRCVLLLMWIICLRMMSRLGGVGGS
jgi:hypothetical protein